MISPQTPNTAQRTDQIQNSPKIITGTGGTPQNPRTTDFESGVRLRDSGAIIWLLLVDSLIDERSDLFIREI